MRVLHRCVGLTAAAALGDSVLSRPSGFRAVAMVLVTIASGVAERSGLSQVRS